MIRLRYISALKKPELSQVSQRSRPIQQTICKTNKLYCTIDNSTIQFTMKRPEPHLRLLQYLKNYDRLHSRSPVIDDMMSSMVKSRSAIQNSLKYLEDNGYIQREHGKARTIRIIDSIQSRDKSIQDSIPLWGSIAAGYLTEAFTDSREIFPISSPKLKQGDFALKVNGNSMIGDHIADGSYVVMRPWENSEEPKNGTIVAAWVEGFGTTLKHFYRDENFIFLKASNPIYSPISIDTNISDCKVQGILIFTWKEWT
jgi:repressor LexA